MTDQSVISKRKQHERQAATCQLQITRYPDERPVRGYTDNNYIAIHQYIPDRKRNGKLVLTADKFVSARVDVRRVVSTSFAPGSLVRAYMKTKQRCAFGLAEVVSSFEARVTGNLDDVVVMNVRLATGLAGEIRGIQRLDDCQAKREMIEWRK